MQPSPPPQPDPWPPKLDSIALEDSWNVEMREAVAACPEFGEWWEKRVGVYDHVWNEYSKIYNGGNRPSDFAHSVSELKKQFVEAKEKEFVDARQQLRQLQWHTEHPRRVAALDAATAKSLKFETRLKELYEQIPRLDEKQVRRGIAAQFGASTFKETNDNRLLQQHQAELESIARLRVTVHKLVHKYGAQTTPDAKAPSPLLEDDVEAQL